MATDNKGKKLPKGIMQRSDGLYRGRFQYNGESFTVYEKTAKKAEKKMQNLRYEVEHGLFAREEDIVVDNWFTTWIDVYKRSTVKNGTIANYEVNYEKHIQPTFGKRKIKDIRTAHIQKSLNELAKQYSKGVVTLVCVVWHGMYKQAVKDGVVRINPVTNVMIPRGKDKKEKVVLTVTQQKQFLKYAEQESRFLPLYQLALCTGMRIGEVLGLQWNDVDFENRTIHITHTLKYIKGIGLYLETPKTKTSKRDIPMIDKAYHVLWTQKKIQAVQKMKMGEHWRPLEGLENIVFTKCNGTTVNRELVATDINEVTKRLQENGIEIEHFTFHCFRHTFATRAIEAGMQPKTLQTILGHSTLAMTMDLYAHVLPSTKVDEMEKIASIL